MLLSRARPSSVEAILRDLASNDAAVRVQAADECASVIGDVEGEPRTRVIAALVRALGADGHAQARAAAALALADLRAHEALPALLVAADDDAPLVRQLAITALGEIGDVRARERIRRALGDERPEVRFQAIVAFPRLAKRDDDEAGTFDAWSALQTGLADDDAQVRGRAAEACGELADAGPLPDAIADRLAALLDGKSQPSDVRVASAIALAESGDMRGEGVLLDVMAGRIQDPDPGRVQAAFELAGELGLEAARPLAQSAAFGFRAIVGDPGRHTAAIVALVRLGDARAIEHVLSGFTARSFGKRMLAVAIAGRAELVDARPHLQSLRRDARLADPEAVDDALARIDAADSSRRVDEDAS